MTHEAVLFTLHTEMTWPKLFAGLAIAGLITMIGTVLLRKVFDDIADRNYEKGYEAYANELADDMAEEFDEELTAVTEAGGFEEYFEGND